MRRLVMKLYFISIIILLYINITNIYSQEGSKDEKPELFMQTENVPSELTLIYQLFRIGKVYTHDGQYENWEECGNCDVHAEETITGNYDDGKGWNISFDSQPDDELEAYGYGLYKFSNNRQNTNTYFYFDFRDNNYNINYGTVFDFYLEYNYSSDSYEYRKTNGTWEPIETGELVPIWKIKGSSLAVKTSDFPSDYWQNCLNLVHYGDEPEEYKSWLIWSPNPNFSASAYKVYRSIPGTIKYTTIATVNSETFDYIDKDTFYENTDGIKYYVKAYNGSTYSTRTNIVNTPQYKMPKTSSSDLDIIIDNYLLHQNYPNPFNPTTKITYQIPKKGEVVLKVYNVLGKEVAELVNEEKGIYTVTFGADKFPSAGHII